MIAALIIGIIFLLIGTIWSVVDDDEWKGLIFMIGVIGAFLLIISLAEYQSGKDYKQGQIDTLEGKYKYEQSIQYEYKDNNYIPVDTVYKVLE